MLRAVLNSVSNSTAYGLPNLVKSKRLFHKLMWLFFMVSSTSASIWYIISSISNYFKYDTVTLIKSVYEQPSRFPTISFCSYNGKSFDNKSLNEFITDLNFGYNLSLKNNLQNYFDPFYTLDYGQCYHINSGRNIRKQNVGFLYSIIGGLDDSLSLYMNISSELLIWIHNETSPPKLVTYDSHYGNRLFVRQNMYTQIAIDKKVEFKLGLPYNQCYKDVIEFPLNKTLISFISTFKAESYSQIKCLELCFDLKYIEENPCNCSNPTLGNVWEHCWLDLEKSNHSSCTWNYKTYFYSKNIVEECSQYCPLECDSYTYKTEANYIYDKNKIRMKIFYRSLRYELIEQTEKYFLQDLIASIGGILSLLIGVSFVSIFEIIELFTELISIFVNKHANSSVQMARTKIIRIKMKKIKIKPLNKLNNNGLVIK